MIPGATVLRIVLRRAPGAWRALGLALVLSSGPAHAEAPVIAAAADLQFALAEIALRFEAEHGQTVRLAFGSSGNFARQIRQGAPFEMYLSADEHYVLELARDGLTHDEGALYAEGRIVLIVPRGSPLRADGTLADLAAAVDDSRLQRLAIANPEHAPYGRAAREALRSAGVWDRLQDRLILGENVTQAAQFATSGATQGGIIAYSLVLSPKLSRAGDFALIPAEWHEPLRQRMVLTRKAGAAARRFYAYVQEPAARAILRRYGFAAPHEAP